MQTVQQYALAKEEPREHEVKRVELEAETMQVPYMKFSTIGWLSTVPKELLVYENGVVEVKCGNYQPTSAIDETRAKYYKDVLKREMEEGSVRYSVYPFGNHSWIIDPPKETSNLTYYENGKEKHLVIEGSLRKAPSGIADLLYDMRSLADDLCIQ
jgi:hypothetical protein